MINKKHIFILLLIIGLFAISSVSANDLNTTDDDLGIQMAINESNFENDFLSTDIIYFDASAEVNGDGSQSKPFKYVNQNTLNVNSGNDITAYFAEGTYDINTPFRISSNVVLIGQGKKNTIFNSVLQDRYDFEIMSGCELELQDMAFEHVNILNHGDLEAHDVFFTDSQAFSGDNAPSTFNAYKYNSSYGGVINCDPMWGSSPYVYLENCFFNNTAAYNGGAISLKNSRLAVKGSEFYHSSAEHLGGVIYSQNSEMTMFDAVFAYNNASYGGVIYCENSVLDFNKVNFYYSTAYGFGGSIASKYCDMTLNSCDFGDSYSLTDAGGSIYNFGGNLLINDSLFRWGYAEFGGVIANLNSNLTVYSSFFHNNYARLYGGVIYNMYGKMHLEDNIFYRSFATFGSVISSELSDVITLKNNYFVNFTSTEEESAVLIDTSKEFNEEGNHFENAYYFCLEFTGYLNDEKIVVRSNLLNYILSNTGKYEEDDYEEMDFSGDYSSYLRLQIHDSEYPDNSTIFHDFDEDFEIVFDLSLFSDDIQGSFLKFCQYNALGILVCEDAISFDQFDFDGSAVCRLNFKPYMIKELGDRFMVEHSNVPLINSSTSDLDYIPSRYDSRDYGYITPVKDQADGGNCWAFAGIATLEACIKKITNITYDFSEENVKNIMASFSRVGLLLPPNEGGYESMVMGYLTSWFGPILEESDPYDDLSSIGTVFEPDFHIQNIYILPARENGLNDDLYKKAIMDYGAIAVSLSWPVYYRATLIDWDDSYKGKDAFGDSAEGAWIFNHISGDGWETDGFGYISYKTLYDESYKESINRYGSLSISFNRPDGHAISIVGWDDNYNGKDSLGNNAKGVWIFKNSWGTDWADNGFGYLSYDVPFLNEYYEDSYVYTFIFNENDNYVVNDHTDYSGLSDYIGNLGPIYCKILFDETAADLNMANMLDDGWAAFSTYFKVPTNYTVSVFDKNDNLILYQEGFSPQGYYTIPFERIISVDEMDGGVVMIGYCNEGTNYLPVSQFDELATSRVPVNSSLCSFDGGKTFHDLSGYGEMYQMPCIHLFAIVSDNFSATFDVDLSEFDNLDIGQEITVNVTLTDPDSRISTYFNNKTIENMEGTLITVNVDAKNYYAKIHNGKASLTLSFDKAGIYELTAQYRSNMYDSEVAGFNFTVNQIDTETTISSDKNSENSVTLTASVNSPDGGEIVFNVNGEDYPAEIVNGQASVKLSNLDAGSYVAKATYRGSVNYKVSSSKSISFEVEESGFRIEAPDVVKFYGGPERFAVTLKDTRNNPIANASVKISINGVNYTRTTDADGMASMALGLPSKVYTVTTSYGDYEVESTVTIKDTVYAEDFTKMYKNATQYYGTFVDAKGNRLAENTPIEININGVFYTRYTNDKGVARMNINLNPGTYVLTAKNPSTGEMHTTTITVLATIVENYDLTKYYRNASQYSLRLLDDKGNPVKAGVDVRLNINGVFYTRTSNADGYVKMNINLEPGEYVITAEYNGLMASNTIKVLSVIETRNLIMKYKDGSKFEAKILDGQGKVYPGQKVTFNINGVFYEKITDETGVARLTINLMAGEYIITTSYNGMNAANKVTISS